MLEQETPQSSKPSDASSDIFTEDDFALPENEQSPTQNATAYDEDTQTDTDTPNQRDIQDLTIAQVLGQLRRAPQITGRALWDVLKLNSTVAPRMIEMDAPTQSEADVSQSITENIAPPNVEQRNWLNVLQNLLLNRQRIKLVLYVIAFVVVAFGATLWASDTSNQAFLNGRNYVLSGFILWLIAEIIGQTHNIQTWFRKKDSLAYINLGLRAIPLLFIMLGAAILWDSTDAPTDNVLAIASTGVQLVIAGMVIWGMMDIGNMLFRYFIRTRPHQFPTWMVAAMQDRIRRTDEAQVIDVVYRDPVPLYMRIPLFRFVLALGGMVACIMVWFGTSDNTFTTPIFYLWLLSIALWSFAFAPLHWNPLNSLTNTLDRIRRFNIGQHRGVIIALIVIMLTAGWFRFYQLDQHPREMTDDHVEKILDAGRVRDGARNIWFANNGGREPFQMYAIAMASYLPGLDINHFTIKVVASLESLLTVLVLFWMVFEVLERESLRRRILAGLFAAALLAGSYWHVAITRQGLRIPLTALFAALLLIYLARAMRRNARADFIKAGLVLGFGLYMYQAVRMLPLVVLVGVGLAFYFAASSWKDRLRYAINLSVLVGISFVIFLPLFHYSTENPDQFLRRTFGRLLGDDVITATLPDGTVVQRNATAQEQFEAFQSNVPVLMSNIRNAMLMFNRKGDVAAISGVPNKPAMDVLSGTLLILGLSAWIALAIRRRDVVYWLMPLFIFIMLLPSALSIAFPVENPSHTRTSGAIPVVYMVTALPLVLFAETWMKQFDKRFMHYVGVGLCGVVILGSYQANAYTYFDEYPPIYAASFDPYSEPGQYLQGFALSNGTYGNAFMIGYPHWWSHRAIGLAAGLDEQWLNGVVSRANIPRDMYFASQRVGKFAFDANHDILFFVSPNDDETIAYLEELFPNGYMRLETTYAPNNDYRTYTVPALGDDQFQSFLDEHYFELN